MAEVTWQILTCFGIESQVHHYLLIHQVILSALLQLMVIMTDNTSNNNTLVDEIIEHAKKQGISMRSDWVYLHCMPHTIHLVALKVFDPSFFL